MAATRRAVRRKKSFRVDKKKMIALNNPSGYSRLHLMRRSLALVGGELATM
jgi:hypothetical protein